MTSAVRRDPALRRTWLFGPGTDTAVHKQMAQTGADVLIVDLEDFTLPERRGEARQLLKPLLAQWREANAIACVRINSLDGDAVIDLQAAMAAGAEIIAYPMAESATQMRRLAQCISEAEQAFGLTIGQTEILPVCETALGVVNVIEMARASSRIRSALLGVEDLVSDLCAQRGADGIELDYARRRFVFECRAAQIEPIDAPYTYNDEQGVTQEAIFARRLGYLSKSAVRCAHVSAINHVLTPSHTDVLHAMHVVERFEQARHQGQDRALVDGLWVEAPTYRNAMRLLKQHAAFESVNAPNLPAEGI